jgi:hypothetical protein
MPASHSTPWLPAIQIHQPVCGVYKRERLRTDFCATPFSFLCPWRRSPWARLTAGTDTALALRRPVAGTRAFGSKIGSNLAELPKAREASKLTDQFTACGINLAPSAITRLLGKISDI